MTGNAQYRQLGFPELYDFPVYQIFPYRDAFRLHRQAERLGLLLGGGKALHVRFMGFRAQPVGVMDEFVAEYVIQMEVRTTQPCRKEFDFTVPADVVKSETANTLRDIAAQVALPGFRPGKAPVGLIRSKFENELKDELQRKLVYAAFELAGKDESLDIVSCGVEGKPELKFDEEFKFTIGADVAPEFEVGDYKTIKVEIPVDAVTDEQVEERVKFYRSAYGNYTEVDGPAQAEDMLKVNYKSDFAAPEDASPAVKRQLEAENTFLWLSEPETIPGSIAALTGAKKDGEYTFEAAYPADYRESALAGKTMKYTHPAPERAQR